MYPVMIMPQLVMPYPAPMGLPYPLAPPTGAPVALQHLISGGLNYDVHQNDLIKLGGLYSQMVTL